MFGRVPSGSSNFLHKRFECYIFFNQLVNRTNFVFTVGRQQCAGISSKQMVRKMLLKINLMKMDGVALSQSGGLHAEVGLYYDDRFPTSYKMHLFISESVRIVMILHPLL